jgi:hypothetical protein
MDGWVWDIEIVRGKFKVQVTGRNAYPSQENLAKSTPGFEPTVPFQHFEAALERLIGFKPW